MAITNETLRLRAKAKRAGIPNYGSMSADELRTALAGGKGSKKRKSASTLGKRKSASAVTKRTSSTRKSAKKAPAAKSVKSGKAKRSSSGGRKRVSSTARKAAHAKPRASSNSKPGRNLIDRSSIDWKLDWAGGESGNRGIIMKALRKHRGNYAKVYDALKGNARKMFPKSSKTGERYSADKSRAQLKWYIGRTAFDYVTATGQHQKSTNRKADRRTNGKAAGSRQTRKTGSGRAKSTPKAARAQKGSRKRTAASSRKRTTAKRKSVKR